MNNKLIGAKVKLFRFRKYHFLLPILLVAGKLNSQNVGIGTNTPAALLHVNGTANWDGNVVFTGQVKSPAGDPPVSGNGYRMMWYLDKGAFRAGRATNLNWDKDSIGEYSVAMGAGTIAKRTGSTAFGSGSSALGLYATAFGRYALSSGESSVAGGQNTEATGSFSTAFGIYTKASNFYTTALGYFTTASGSSSTAMGTNTLASGGASTAIGSYTLASGAVSTAMGVHTRANAFASTAIGRYNVGGGNPGAWNNSDPLFEIGNGANEENRNNALTILKNGNAGIGTNSPLALLHVNGSGTGGGNVVFTGAFKNSNPGAPPVSGSGTRMMWYPDKGAFRAGGTVGNTWDLVKSGTFSIGLGYNTEASGFVAVAVGIDTKSSGYGSFASGDATTASGDESVAMGRQNMASNNGAVALGFYNEASGITSLATNINTRAAAYASTAMGRFNMGTGTPNTWVSTESLFEIGNGTATNSRSNAFTVLKNGKTGILTPTPNATLHINHTNAAAGTMPDQGLRIQNTSGTNRIWNLYTFSSNGALALYAGTSGVSVGNFNAGTGAYTATSNRHLKTNVHLLDADVLSRIQQLQPATYSYIRDPMKQRTVGFMAEDVESIFPELVDTVGENGENLAINYAGFSVVAIKAIQLLQEKLDEKEKRIETLEAEMKEIKKWIIEKQ